MATLLADGRVLVAGGIRIANGVFTARLSSAEIFDPATGNFTPAASMGTDRQSPSAVLLANGKVLVTGGFGNTGFGYSAWLPSAELFDPATGGFAPTGSMSTGRGMHQLTLLASGRVLATGGTNGSGIIVNTAEQFDRRPSAREGQQQAEFHMPRPPAVVGLSRQQRQLYSSIETFSP